LRLLRLRLAAVRGVAECEVEFAPRGVTVVEGPNESGKTTLAESLDLLLEKLDSSTDRTVRALQPAGSDAGSEIEAEIEAGRYALRIFKRFNRNRETVLEVHAPAPETLSGREAHERLRAILAESVDLDLWRALRVEQGRSLEQAALGGARSLLAALEGVAAGADGAAGEREEGLFERVRAEYCTYFTPARGQPTGELKEAEERAVALRAAVALADEELAELEADVERHDRLRRRAAELAGAAEAAERERAAAARRLEEVERLAGEVEGRRSTLRDEEGKLRLLRELDQAGRAEAELAGRLAAAERELAAAQEALAPAEQAAAEAEEEVAAARREAERARAAERRAVEHQRREELAAARARLASAEERVATLDAALAAHPVTAEALRSLETKDRAAERTAAALEAARAGVELEALAALQAEIGGERVALEAGERLERPVAEPLAIELPDLARLTVTPGRDVTELASRAAAARAELTAALKELRVDDFAAARTAHGERLRLEADRAAAEAERREVERACGGGAAEGIIGDDSGVVDSGSTASPPAASRRAAAAGGRRATAEPSLVGAGVEPAPATESEPPLKPEEALRARAAAEAALATAEGQLAPLALAREERRQAVARARDLHKELAIERRHAGERSVRAGEGIEALVAALSEEAASGASGDAGSETVVAKSAVGRAEAGTDQLDLFRAGLERPDLEPALAAAERREAAAREALAAAREKLTAAEPEAVRRRALELTEDAARRRRELSGVESELSEIHGRLAARGERGLFDRAADARAELAAAERRARALGRRAAAARRLYETLAEARDRARAAYGEPLRRAIEELGRPLYGEGFAVELDDELRIARRTLNGVTLAVEQLSAGAREQLALLARLACARLAAAGADGEGGGVPVVLDDALGHTDPERLRALARVLACAAETCQVIVLTSDPARYAAVPGARVVRVG
jgi:DNA repair exonuclease SbcCD ATPase subunit